MEIRKGVTFIGELPKVIIQPPFIKTSGHSARCTGCDNIVHCLDLETAICPYCVSKQIERQNEIPT